MDTLVEIGSSRAVDPLISSLGDKNYQVRRSAAEGLGKLGDRKAVELCLKLLRPKERQKSEFRRSWLLGSLEESKLSKV